MTDRAEVAESTAADPSSEAAQVSVIVPTFNRHFSLERLLESLTRSRRVAEVVVVDDASDPPVAARAAKVRVVRSDRSLLVSAARNVGARAARGDILVFIDDDCIMEERAVEALVEPLERCRDVGMTGPVIAFLSSPVTIWCAGVCRSIRTGRTFLRGNGRDLAFASGLPAECDDFPSAFAVRKEDWERIGGFDETTFPMHLEEADFAARLRSRGLSIRIVPQAIVLHDLPDRAPLARRLHMVDPRRAFLVGRSRMRYIRRHAPSAPRRVAWSLFWLLALVPVHVLAALSQKRTPLARRVAVARAFSRGVWTGARPSRRREPQGFSASSTSAIPRT